MARPRTPVGTHGRVRTNRLSTGRFRARTDYRDWNGLLRQISAVGTTPDAAERALRLRIRDRLAPITGAVLSSDATVAHLAAFWLQEHDASESSMQVYESVVRLHIVPTLGALTIREVSTPIVAKFFKAMEEKPGRGGKPMSTRTIRAALSAMFSLAVEYGAVPHNPVSGLVRRRRKHKEVQALEIGGDTIVDLNAIRDILGKWEDGTLTGRPHNSDLRDTFEFGLATGTRIGETLAVRWCDLALDVEPALVCISGTLVYTKSATLHRQGWPKGKAHRTLTLTPWVTATLLRRQVEMDANPNDAVFPSHAGTWIWPNNLRRDWRSMRTAAGIPDWVTPHTLRKTLGTVVAKAAGSLVASEVLGHSSTKIMEEHYLAETKVAPDHTGLIGVLAPRDWK